MKNQYELLRERIREVFLNLDPPGLIHGGAPDDEYDTEIGLIISRRQEYVDEEKTLEVVFDIFSSSLEKSAGNKENYRDVAIQVYRIVKETLG